MPRYISTSILSFHGSDYIMPRYIHHDSLVPWDWLYHATIYPPQLSSSIGVITLSRSISTPLSNCMGMLIMLIMPWCISTPHKNLGLIIMTLYFHCWQYLVKGDYIVALYFHSWQYLVRGWLYRDIIFSLLTIFGEGVIISYYIFIPDNIWWGGDYIVTLYFHSWQYLVRGWLYRDIIFSLLTIFGKGVIISWHIFILTIFGLGMIISWDYIFIPDNIWRGGDNILTLYFHSWQYLLRGLLYRETVLSLLTIFGEGWLYRDIVFSLLTIFGEGVIISWLHFHSWQYLARVWLYCDIKFSFPDTPQESGNLELDVIIFEYFHYPTRVLLYIYICSPHETWGLEGLYLSMISSLLLTRGVLGWYVNGLYQESVMTKSL